MNWLNISISNLRSPEFINAEPNAISAWLKLTLYCCERENGGTIKGASEWTDRQWMTACGVTASEVHSAAPLVIISGQDVSVSLYPKEKESEVKTKRAVAAKNGITGGRPRKTTKVEPTLDNPKKPTLVSDREPILDTPLEKYEKAEREREREREEEKELEGELELELLSSVESRPDEGIEDDSSRSIHSQITSRIGAVFTEITGEAFAFSPRFAKELSKFLKGWNGSSREWLDHYGDVLTYGQYQFATKMLRDCADPSSLCRNWMPSLAEVSKLRKSDHQTEVLPQPSRFKKTI